MLRHWFLHAANIRIFPYTAKKHRRFVIGKAALLFYYYYSFFLFSFGYFSLFFFAPFFRELRNPRPHVHPSVLLLQSSILTGKIR